MANILVADKDATMRELLDVALKRISHEVKLADTGPQAIELIRREHFDLAILDYSLPELSVIEILGSLRENGNEIPNIMVLSSKGTTDTIRECVEAGARDYIVKPFNLPVLIERIQILIH